VGVQASKGEEEVEEEVQAKKAVTVAAALKPRELVEYLDR
jgi:hypothetical protein